MIDMSVRLTLCRSVVIALLKAKKGTGLRKIDIMEAAKIALKCEVPNNAYTKVYDSHSHQIKKVAKKWDI